MKTHKPPTSLDRLRMSTGLAWVKRIPQYGFEAFSAYSPNARREYNVEIDLHGKCDLFIDLTQIVTAGTLADCINAVRQRESGT